MYKYLHFATLSTHSERTQAHIQAKQTQILFTKATKLNGNWQDRYDVHENMMLNFIASDTNNLK